MASTGPNPLDYSPPPPARRVFSAYVFLMYSILLMFVTGICVILVPFVQRAIASTGLQVGGVTVAYFHFGHAFARGLWIPLWSIPFLAAFLPGLLMPHDASPRARSKIDRAVFWLFLFLCAIFASFTVLGILLPVARMVTAVTKP